MKKRGNIVGLPVSETRARIARTPDERDEAAADLVIERFVAGMRMTDADAVEIARLLQTADARVSAARKVG